MAGPYRGRVVLGGGILCGIGLLGSAQALAADLTLPPPASSSAAASTGSVATTPSYGTNGQAGPQTPGPGPGTLTILPAFAIGESYNDNVNLGPRGQELGAFITTLNPSINILDDSSRLKLNALYSPQELIYYGDISTQHLQQNLQSNGELTLFPELLFLDANATITQAFLNPTGPIGATTLTTNNNLQEVQAYNVSPVLKHRFGDYFSSETRYTLGYVTTSGEQLPPLLSNEAKQVFTSGEYFGRFGWSATADVLHDKNMSLANSPLSNTTFKDEYVRFDPKYAIYRGLALLAGIGWEHVVGPTVTIQPYEVIWDIGFQFTPNPYTKLSATYGERYGGSDIEISGNYNPSPQTNFTISYTKQVQSSQAQFAAAQNLFGFNQSGQLVNLQTGQPVPIGIANGQLINLQSGLPINFGASFGGGAQGLSSFPFISKIFQTGVTLTRGRNTYAADIFYDTYKVQAPPSNQRTYGASLSYTRQLWPALSGNIMGTYSRTNVSGNPGVFGGSLGGNTTLYAATAGLSYNLSETATAQFTLTHSTTESTTSTGTIDDDVMTVMYQKRF